MEFPKDQEPVIVVVGAGPAGALAASAFARHGYKVKVYERRGRPEPDANNHNFTIVLNNKGLGAISAVGIPARLLDFPLLACVRHSPTGSFSQAFLRPRLGAAANFERNELTAWLQQQAHAQYPGVEWHFEHRCMGVDFETRTALFKDANDAVVSVPYTLLIAADGASSVVRESLVAHQPSFQVSRKEAPLVYKRFQKFKCDADLSSKYGQGAVLNFYPVAIPSALKGQPKWGFVTLVNHKEGTFSGGLSVYTSVQHLFNTPEDYEAAIRLMPLPQDVRQRLAATLHSAPWSWGGTWVRCSALHGPAAILVGDAAHSVTPSLGQGCNCALEDVTVLQQQLDALLALNPATALQELPAAFTRVRLADVHALVWLDEHARAFRGQMGVANRYFWMYMAHMHCRPLLHALAPGLVERPALQRVWEGPCAYTHIKEQLLQDGQMLAYAAGLTLAAAVAAGALALLRPRS